MSVSFIRLGQVIGVVVLATACASGTPTAAASQHPAKPVRGAVGNDVGNLSCSTALPTGGSFGIVGATAGKPFAPSECLASEYAWATRLTYRPEYYLNLADPGHKSSHWGHGGPRTCHAKPKYDLGCAFNYGYETAATAVGYVTAVGSSAQGRWWLDVEVDNSWGTTRAGIAANIADIQGAIDYLRMSPSRQAGIYTETSWWDTITHGTRAFAHTAVWGGGANSRHHALGNCRTHSITGGPALIAQWIVGATDHDVAC